MPTVDAGQPELGPNSDDANIQARAWLGSSRQNERREIADF
jgi:hypothetical protein